MRGGAAGEGVRILRAGRWLVADEAFHAWNSGDLERMVAALEVPTNPIDRHHLLQQVVALAYKGRRDPALRDLCVQVGRQHLREFPVLGPALVADLGMMPRVSVVVHLATVLTEAGRYDEAAEVCRQAMTLGARDGTKGGLAARIRRIERVASHAAQAP